VTSCPFRGGKAWGLINRDYPFDPGVEGISFVDLDPAIMNRRVLSDLFFPPSGSFSACSCQEHSFQTGDPVFPKNNQRLSFSWIFRDISFAMLRKLLLLKFYGIFDIFKIMP
jgi:hypothetical protein